MTAMRISHSKLPLSIVGQPAAIECTSAWSKLISSTRIERARSPRADSVALASKTALCFGGKSVTWS